MTLMDEGALVTGGSHLEAAVISGVAISCSSEIGGASAGAFSWAVWLCSAADADRMRPNAAAIQSARSPCRRVGGPGLQRQVGCVASRRVGGPGLQRQVGRVRSRRVGVPGLPRLVGRV